MLHTEGPCYASHFVDMTSKQGPRQTPNPEFSDEEPETRQGELNVRRSRAGHA